MSLHILYETLNPQPDVMVLIPIADDIKEPTEFIPVSYKTLDSGNPCNYSSFLKTIQNGSLLTTYAQY